MESQIETRKIELTKKNNKEGDFSFLQSEYSNDLMNIKNICSSAVGTASEMFPHLEKLREPFSIKIVDDCMHYLKTLVNAYEKTKEDAKYLSNQIKNHIQNQ